VHVHAHAHAHAHVHVHVHVSSSIGIRHCSHASPDGGFRLLQEDNLGSYSTLNKQYSDFNKQYSDFKKLCTCASRPPARATSLSFRVSSRTRDRISPLLRSGAPSSRATWGYYYSKEG
jgi:hypothetical protein